MTTRHFLLTDIEGSTSLWDLHPKAMREALAGHDDLLVKAIEGSDGKIFKHTGDGMLAVFGSASDAIGAAAAAQRALAGQAHPDVGVLKVRMAVHSGPAEERDGDYFGPSLNRASRLMSAAHGGQVLVSLVSERLAARELAPELTLRPLGRHRLKDLTEPEEVFQLSIEGVPAEFPALRTPDIVPNNLPVLPTSFVGRDDELAEVEKLVRAARVVTLTGVGGAGKTRLALQVAAALSEEEAYADGVWFVELAAVTDPDLVPAQAAGALGLQESPGRPIRDTLLDHLAGRSVLLLLDNCEHLIDAAADLAEGVIRVSPTSHVIATSRELLGVGGEVAYGIRSMAMPKDVSDLGPVELARFDAVRLFEERAAASKPDFQVTAANAPGVLEICRRLDGMPLAIELAAARVRSFTPLQIADFLDQRFRILTGGARTALPRQQTLAATIDWSYRLLDERERLLFERLSMFLGGFDLEAAQAVCSGDGLDEFDVLELVPTLVDKSLINADVGGDAARYRLLETIRQFARDKLDEAGATDAVRRRHAEHFIALAQEAEPNVRGAREKEWWDRLDTELDNLRAAMEWSIEAGEPEMGLRLAGAFWRFWWFTFRFSEGVQWLHRMYEARGETSGAPLARVMVGLGTLSGFVNDSDTAEEMLGSAIRLYRELDEQGVDPELMRYSYSAALINYSAISAEPAGDFDLSRRLNEEALAISRRIGDRVGVAVALGNLAETAARMGDAAEARRGYAEAIEASRALNSSQRLVEAMIQAAMFEIAFDNPQQAAVRLEETQTLAEEGNLRMWAGLAGTLRALAGNDMGESDARDRSVHHARAMYDDPEFLRFYWGQLVVTVCRADLEITRGDPERGATLLGILSRLEAESSPLMAEFEARRGRLEEEAARTLGDGYEAALARGRDMDPAEASRVIAGE